MTNPFNFCLQKSFLSHLKVIDLDAQLWLGRFFWMIWTLALFSFLWLDENPDVILTRAPPPAGLLGHCPSLFHLLAVWVSAQVDVCVLTLLRVLCIFWICGSVFILSLFFSSLPLFPDPLLGFIFNYIWKLMLATSTTAAVVHVVLGACGYLHPPSCLCPLSVSQLEELVVLFAQSSSGFLSQTAKSLTWPKGWI